MLTTINSIAVVVTLTAIGAIVLTFPAWAAGAIVGTKKRRHSVPGLMRPWLVRWAIWVLGAATGVFLAALAITAHGAADATRIGLAATAAALILLALWAAYFIGYTVAARVASWRRRAFEQ